MYTALHSRPSMIVAKKRRKLSLHRSDERRPVTVVGIAGEPFDDRRRRADAPREPEVQERHDECTRESERRCAEAKKMSRPSRRAVVARRKRGQGRGREDRNERALGSQERRNEGERQEHAPPSRGSLFAG